MKRQLKKLSDKQFAEDIKTYIKSNHEFYSIKVPELKILAKKLHDEQNLKDFYKVFNRLYKSSLPGKNSLAIYTFQLYKDEFDFHTWDFLKLKLKDMKSWDQIDSFATGIVGEILLKYPRLEKEILKMAKGKDVWLRRMAIVSTLPLIKKGDVIFPIRLIEENIDSKELHIQKAVGWILKEIGNRKPEIAKRFILKHMQMPAVAFNEATENMKELRKLKKIKKLKDNKKAWFFWRGAV